MSDTPAGGWGFTVLFIVCLVLLAFVVWAFEEFGRDASEEAEDYEER